MLSALPTRRLLPLLILMAFVMLGQRGYNFWHGLQYGVSATAQEPAPVHTPAAALAPVAAPSSAPAPAVAPAATAVPAPVAAPAPVVNSDMSDMPGEYTPAEVKVLQALSKRREELAARAAELDQREALLQVTENRVQQKLKEMEDVRTELAGMLKGVDKQQNDRIASLVKMYETMKPQEAAAILETLEMKVTLDILGQMKETKSAPILAKMTPQKASEITVEMSRRSQLPEVP